VADDVVLSSLNSYDSLFCTFLSDRINITLIDQLYQKEESDLVNLDGSVVLLNWRRILKN
jgi:hypothetical protein